MTDHSWLLPGATKDTESITAGWDLIGQQPIEGAVVREVKNVPNDNGALTEIFRRDWFAADDPVDQVFQVRLLARAYSAWHAHAETVDRLFIADGAVKIVLYDSRRDSATYGIVNELRIGTARPALVVVPPRVWHGVFNLADTAAIVVNLVDRAYRYSDPDHWRVPADSPDIPYCALHGRDCAGRHLIR